MSKQDRQGVRTPADVERKYNLGQLASAQGASVKVESALQQLSQSFANYVADANAEMEELNNKIDEIGSAPATVPDAVPIPRDTDFNTLTDINRYIGDASGTGFINCPFSDGTFDLDVVAAGSAGQRKQIATKCDKEKPDIAVRFFYQGAWGEWIYLHRDTGWIDLTLSSGITVADSSIGLKGRIKNGILYIRGAVNGVTTDYQEIATLPSALKSAITATWRLSAVYDMNYFCGLGVFNTGKVNVAKNSIGSWDSTKAVYINITLCL